MRFLITGGRGFIGGRLAVHLSKAGHSVVIGSRSKHDAPEWLPKAESLQMDWGSLAALRDACTNVDVVIHAAGMNSMDCQRDPLAALEFNGTATARLARAASEMKVTTFIYLSTAHVYSSLLVGQFNENTTPNNSHPYGTSHLAGEKAILDSTLGSKMNRFVLRFSNVYGAPTYVDSNSWVLLVNDLCLQAVTLNKIAIESNGSIQRNFLTMTDACSVIESLVGISEKQKIPNILNVGNQLSETISGMATLIQKRCVVVLGTQPTIEYLTKETIEAPRVLKYESLHSSLFVRMIKDNRNYEIDSLLKFCVDSFTMKSGR